MAKIYGLFGAMTGKLADTVMSVRNGEQIARKYQPVVYNPSTPAQVAQRAKLKLLSQLSAVCAPVIAIPRQGAVSSRNLFTKKNYPLVSYNTDTASIDLNEVQLTSSVVALPPVLVSRGGDNIDIFLASSAAAALDVDRVVYCIFEKQADEHLRLYASAVVTTPGANNQFPTSIANSASSLVVLAYGVRDNTEAARAAFGNLEAPSATQVADLIVTRSMVESDITLTETRGATLAAQA